MVYIDSVTGDKAPNAFEDDYLELLFEVIKGLNIRAVTYAPSRNSDGQLNRLIKLYSENGMFQICGEDINSLDQSFVCEKLDDTRFSQLLVSNKALLAHEKLASYDLKYAFEGAYMSARFPELQDKINFVAACRASFSAE